MSKVKDLRFKACSLIFAIFILLSAVHCLLLAANAKAEDYAVAQGYAHIFNNNISVYTGVFALNKDVNLDTSLYFKVTGDSIQGVATTDVSSGASSVTYSTSSDSSISDFRKEVTAGVSRKLGDIADVEFYYDYSEEKDYISTTPSITLKKELFEKNTSLILGYSNNADEIKGRFMDETKGKNTDNYYLGVAQVISPYTIAQIGYSASRVSGFTSEGIRLVPVDGATKASCVSESATCVEEAFPDSRTRNAYMLGVNHFFPQNRFGDGYWGLLSLMNKSSIKLFLRYYTDDWGVSSHTEEIEYNKYLTEETVFKLNFRYYNQSKANFVKDAYAASDKYKVSSPQLVKFNSQLAGAKIIHTIKNTSKGSILSFMEDGSVEAKYEFYIQSINVNAHIIMLALRFVF
ncbi:MAG: DUF3570 domain-containing protein [Deltaproteobacteria bacterium]|nr:DUF3570 domain-containing protein [Deltaproteobacteria bacterium]